MSSVGKSCLNTRDVANPPCVKVYTTKLDRMMTKQSNKKTIQYGMASLVKYQFASFVSIWFILKFFSFLELLKCKYKIFSITPHS